MKKITLLMVGLTFLFTARSQETVVWGAEVIDVSSEFDSYQYSAIEALHRPNVLSSGGEKSPYAWRPKQESREEFIMVAFDEPIKAKQVAIAESENPGAIKAVYAYDVEYNEYLLVELTPEVLPIPSRLLNLFFNQTSYNIQAIRVVLDGKVVPGYNSIDAIGISMSNIPIDVLIDLAPGINMKVEAYSLSNDVNSNYVEHGPIISPDGKRLYFSRQYHPDNVGGTEDVEDIWVSELDESTGEWLQAKNLGPPLNNEGPNFVSSISIVEGEEILALGNRYEKKGRIVAGVSLSTREGDEYTAPKPVEIENEYNYSPHSDFFLGPRGQAMILSAERDDSYGGRDLYVSIKQGKTWGEPLNLGRNINTVGEDESPFLAQDGKTLYFSSNGYNGYGGADIYVSFKLDSTWTNWSDPENLGAGINQEGDDEYFSIPSSGQHIYFSRGEKGKNTDIYRFKVDEFFVDKESPIIPSVEHLLNQEIFIQVTGNLLNQRTGKPVAGATVVIERLPDGVDIGEVVTDPETGTYKVKVRAGARYGIIGTADGFIAQSENFDFNNITSSRIIHKDLKMIPIDSGETVIFNNIFFDFDRTVLKTASYPELERVLNLLKNKDIESMEISGHTDSTGDEKYNLSLSGRRANSVMNYFLTNGISKSRIEAKAYGEQTPISPNDSAENRRINRRVEFKIK